MGRLLWRAAAAGVSLLGGLAGLAVGATAGWIYERHRARGESGDPDA